MTEFGPDWTVAPAEYVLEHMNDHGVTVGQLADSVSDGSAALSLFIALLITDVLERRPLTIWHAQALEHATRIPARAWLSLEELYRNDLAAGRTDFEAPAEERNSPQ